MFRRILPYLVALGVVAFSLLPGLARAGSPSAACAPVLALPFGGEVRAGQSVEIRWSGEAADVEEMEILLSLDGGRHYPVRVSPELDPRARSFRWRVPNLPSAEARLRVRIGRGAEETWGEATARFVIARAAGPIELAQVHEGEWWSGLDGFETPGACAALGSGGERIVLGSSVHGAATAPRGPGAVRPIGLRDFQLLSRGDTRAAPTVRAKFPRRAIPLRV